ncbi:MAG TPA: carboxypeptidase M32 [Abditibacteriaceae bacterium]|jgi:carboxypeptidase Taq
MSNLQNLKSRLSDVHNLEMAEAVLGWDQETMMPPGGVAARAETRATLAKLSHQLSTSDEIAQLLERAEQDGVENENDAALLRVARRNFDKATKTPPELVEKLSRVSSLAHAEWIRAREENDFACFAPHLETLLDVTRQIALAREPNAPIYDTLLDDYEEGLTCAALEPIWAELKAATVPLVAQIAAAPPIDDSILSREYPIDAQRQFAESVLSDCGFDWNCGRQDTSVHPFCTNFGRGDVRITTRYGTNDLQSALFGSMHEMGHALYEQGSPPEFENTPLAGGVSLGVHESQSRMWENLVGRSRAFWAHYFPKLQSTFPTQLGDVSLDEFYRAINRVNPSLVRVEADEVTYNLHVILRYEIERELLEGKLAVADAPAAWNAKIQSYLGLTPPTDSEGILQDVHWSHGSFGYFPTYSLGNILSVQLWDKAQQSGDVAKATENADFAPLLAWLRENIHRHGRRISPPELVQRATGSPLTVAPYVNYLQTKFGAIYGF